MATTNAVNTGLAGETGTGQFVGDTSPSLTTPDIGIPTAGTLTSCTSLPISTGVSGLGAGVGTFLGTPSSANLASAVTDETGSGALVFANSPAFVTPSLGVASATSLAIVGKNPILTVTKQTFTANGTYTPTTGMEYCIVEVASGGGGSGGCADIAGSAYGISGGGAAGGYSKRLFSASEIGASQAVTVGIGGSGGAAGNNAGLAGGSSIFGAFITCTGGDGGKAGTVGTAAQNVHNSSGGTSTGGDINVHGDTSTHAWSLVSVTIAVGSVGAGNTLSGSIAPAQNAPPISGDDYGGGASGIVYKIPSGGAVAGANGADGIVYITEFFCQ